MVGYAPPAAAKPKRLRFGEAGLALTHPTLAPEQIAWEVDLTSAFLVAIGGQMDMQQIGRMRRK